MDIRKPSGISAVGLMADNQAAREAIEEPLVESQDPGMIALLETAKRAAAGDTTILLTGESGTGKDILARQIHLWSPRRGGPFVAINCTTLAECHKHWRCPGHKHLKMSAECGRAARCTTSSGGCGGGGGGGLGGGGERAGASQ